MLVIDFSQVQRSFRCVLSKIARLCGIEMCSRQSTDLYFRRIGDSVHAQPRGGWSILERTHLRTSLRDRSPLHLVTGEPAAISCAVADSWRTTGRGVCHQNSGDRSSQWEEMEGVDHGNHGGQRARTTRQSRGLSKRHENGSTVRFPFSCPTVAASVRVGSHGRGVAPGPPGGKSDGGVVGEETRLVGTPIHAHSLVEGWERERDGIATPLVLLHDPAGGACGIWWNRYDIARLTRRLPPHIHTHIHCARAYISTHVYAH